MQSKTQRAVIATPPTATVEVCQATETTLVTHYTKLLTPELVIGSRKGTYALVINSSIDGMPLEQMVGTENAKFMTENVLSAVTSNLSTITTQ